MDGCAGWSTARLVGVGRGCPRPIAERSLRASCPPLSRGCLRSAILAPLVSHVGSRGMGSPELDDPAHDPARRSETAAPAATTPDPARSGRRPRCGSAFRRDATPPPGSARSGRRPRRGRPEVRPPARLVAPWLRPRRAKPAGAMDGAAYTQSLAIVASLCLAGLRRHLKCRPPGGKSTPTSSRHAAAAGRAACLGQPPLRGGRGRPEVRPPARLVAPWLRPRRAKPAGAMDGPAGAQSRKPESSSLRAGACSLRTALASICRIRSRVTLKMCPTSSSV
jgi:hypothetical protein